MKYLVALCIIFTACENDTEAPKKKNEEFPNSYRCVINDPEIETVVIRKVTYYPLKNSSTYHMKNFPRSRFNRLNDSSHVVSIKDTVYASCRRQAYFSVIKDWGGSEQPVAWRSYWKLYLFRIDTVQSNADSLYLFTYPEDTIKAYAYKTQSDKDWTYL